MAGPFSVGPLCSMPLWVDEYGTGSGSDRVCDGQEFILIITGASAIYKRDVRIARSDPVATALPVLYLTTHGKA